MPMILFSKMFHVLALALFSLHLSYGESLGLGPKGAKGLRFTFEDGEYEISVMRFDWYSARNLCKSQGGQLLSIETQAENTAVLQALSDFMPESFWTSGSDSDKEGIFYWDSTGAPFENFTFWGPSQPVANNSQHCVELNSSMNHLWADANCDLEKFYICEFRPCSDKLERENDVAKEIKTQSPSLRFTFGNGTYEIVTERATWVGAKNACKLKGMELVSIETFEENLAILDAVVSTFEMNFWTSGSNLGHLGNYYWEGTGHAMGPFTGWAPGQPNEQNVYKCITMGHYVSHMWDDYPCHYSCEYICELQPCQGSN